MKLKVYQLCRLRAAPLTLFFAVVCTCMGCLSPEGPQNCVLIERIVVGSSLARADVQVGDAVVAWKRPANAAKRRPEARGRIASVLDWMELEAEQTPLGPIHLTVWRQGRELNIVVPLGLWDAGVRPWMPDSVLALYQQGKERVDAGNVAAGLALWEQAKRQADAADWLIRFWLGLRSGEAWLKATRDVDAEKSCRQALGEATARRDPVAQIAALNILAKVAESVPDEKKGIDALLETKRLREGLHGKSPGLAKTLHALGRFSLRFGRLDKAETYTQQSLAIYRELAPESLELASSLANLSFLADERGDLAEAERLNGLALSRVRQLAPGTDREVAILNNSAATVMARGRLDAAEEIFLRAYEIARSLDPQNPQLGTLLANLCGVAADRGDLERAEDFCQRAYELHRREAPGSFEESHSLFLLGNIAQKRNQYDKAKQYYDQALVMREKKNSESLPTAFVLHSLGVLAMDRGENRKAEAHLRRALQLRESQAPGGLVVADTLHSLGLVLRLLKEFDEAWKLQGRALKLYEQLAPDSLYEAQAQHELGLIRWQQKDRPEALRRLRAAVDTIEVQAEHVGGGESGEAGFREQSQDLYFRLAELLLAMGRDEEAFAVAERFRGRVFLSLLARRELEFGADLPADLDQERRKLAVQYDRALQGLAQLSVEDPAATELRSQLRLMQAKRDGIVTEIRRRSPRLAALKYFQPLSFKETRAALDPGTAMLSWTVGSDKTLLFIIVPGKPLIVHEISLGAEELRREIEQFTSLLLENANRLGSRPRTGLQEGGRQLYRKLVGPAEEAIASQQRILLVPDGALHLLPFGALIRDLPPGKGSEVQSWQHLVEWKPLHIVLSATVYAELRRPRETRPAAGGPLLIAFGDPLAQGLPRLPGSAEEVRRIGALYPGAEMHLAAEATEARVRSAGPGVQTLHFACHGLLDELMPLNSALALTSPGGSQARNDNGLLQAWEIFEQIRLDADLVVLSACETSQGRPVAGEGLIGLTRAFQYAGARSVVASLWRVSDRSTTELMIRFHRHLRQGMPKDEALRAAQVELLRNGATATAGDTSAPYHWAAFQLFGDRR
jgi:CHAT domain-containing protein/Tfp pilus assembly protein PilF